MVVKTQSFSEHKTGVILVILSAVIFSSAGVFTKAVSAGAWEVVFWRGIFAGAFTVFYVGWGEMRQHGNFRREFFDIGYSGWAVALVGASGMAAFITSLKLTSMANVALIYASTPLMAALLAWLWIGERLGRKLLIGCVAAFSGVLIIVSGSGTSFSLRGDLLAIWMALTLAIVMVIYRRYPDTPVAGPAAISSFVLAPIGFVLGEPLGVSLNEIAILSAFGLVFAVAAITLMEGAKRLPSAETALLSALETPLAPILGWLFFTEVPGRATIVGGSLIMVAVLATQIRI